MSTYKLFKPQIEAAAHIKQIFSNYKGAFLRGEEGTGKTIIAHNIAKDFNKVLFVGEARCLKDLEEKWKDYGKTGETTFMSYNAYTNPLKNPIEKYRDYKLIIFDECHNFRNWGAKTQMMYKRKPKAKYLFMTGTPFIKSTLDGIYFLNKIGTFDDSWKRTNLGYTEWFKKFYFNARKSDYGDYLELGEFQNQEHFYSHLDLVTAKITHKDIDPYMPGINLEIKVLKGIEYNYTGDITKETETALQAGLAKVPQVVEIIKKANPETALILTRFHETAKLLAKELNLPLALNKKDIYKIKNKKKFVTTLGLTSSSFDMNHINNVFLVESTYSYFQDRQSVRRCYRNGKIDELNITYFAIEGEHGVVTSLKRRYLEEAIAAHSPYAPSSLKTLENCPGSFWIKPTKNHSENLLNSGTIGNVKHDAVERHLRKPESKVPQVLDEHTKSCIQYFREQIKGKKLFGIEERVYGKSIHKDFYGHIDLWYYDNDTLSVCDFKSGNHSVPVKDNLQLLAYAFMLAETKLFSPKYLELLIYQKSEAKIVKYDLTKDDIFAKVKDRIKQIIERVEEAKKEPKKHLNKHCNNPFCNAVEIHWENKMGIKLQGGNVGGKEKLPRLAFEGEVVARGVKDGNFGERLWIKLVYPKSLPKTLETDSDKFGLSKFHSLKKDEVAEDGTKYPGFSLFLGGSVKSLDTKDLDLPVRFTATVSVTRRIQQEDGEDRVSYTLKGLKDIVAVSQEESDLS